MATTDLGDIGTFEFEGDLYVICGRSTVLVGDYNCVVDVVFSLDKSGG